MSAGTAGGARFGWLIPMVATMMVQAVLAVNLFALPVVAPQVAADVGIDPSWIGVYSAIVFGCAVFSSLVAGAPVRRWGAVRTGQLCLVLGGGAALAASGSLPLMLMAAIALGLAFGPETPAASHLLARVTTSRNRPLVFSVKQAGLQFGGIGAGLLLPWLLASFGWKAVLIGGGALSLVAALILEPLHRTYDTDRDPRAPLRIGALRQALQIVAKTRALRELALAGFCFSALQQCLNTFLVVHLVRNLNLPLAVAGAALAAAQIAGVASRVGVGVLADRLLSTRSLLVALGAIMTLAALGLVTARAGWPQPAIFALCALFGLSATGWQGIYLAEVARLAPPNCASEATGGIVAAAYGGLVFGPLTFGIMVGSGLHYAAGYFAMAMLSLLGTWALARAAWTTRKATMTPIGPLPVERGLPEEPN
jgi:MFS family permease